MSCSSVSNGATGPTIAVAIDPTAWLGGPDRPPFAAGASLGLTLRPSGAPAPSVDVFIGLPEVAPTSSHRRAVHVTLDGTDLRVLLRPTSGADLSLYPDPSGLGALLAAGTVELLLPMVLDALARLSGSPTRVQIGALVSSFGRGLDIVVDPNNPANPATFDGAKLATLAADPVGRLSARAGALVTQAVAALDPLIAQLPGSPHAALAGGNLVVTVLGITLTFDPSPVSVAISGSVAGLPIVNVVAGSFSADATGLTGWSFGVGPAAFDVGGPVDPPAPSGRTERERRVGGRRRPRPRRAGVDGQRPPRAPGEMAGGGRAGGRGAHPGRCGRRRQDRRRKTLRCSPPMRCWSCSATG